MRGPLQVQDIEEMRRRAGIKDVELRQAIRVLRVGARQNYAPGRRAGCRWRDAAGPDHRHPGGASRGKLADRPTSAGLSGLRPGRALAFTGSHIHSVPGMRADRNG